MPLGDRRPSNNRLDELDNLLDELEDVMDAKPAAKPYAADLTPEGYVPRALPGCSSVQSRPVIDYGAAVTRGTAIATRGKLAASSVERESTSLDDLLHDLETTLSSESPAPKRVGPAASPAPAPDTAGTGERIHHQRTASADMKDKPTHKRAGSIDTKR